MIGNINKVILIGCLGCHPEGRNAPAGKSVVSFSLATPAELNDSRNLIGSLK